MTPEERAKTVVDRFYHEWVFSDDLTQAIAAAIREAEDAAIERAAEIADPPLIHRKGSLGLWRIRRIEISERIRALKSGGRR